MGAGPLDTLRLAKWWAKPFIWAFLAVVLVLATLADWWDHRNDKDYL